MTRASATWPHPQTAGIYGTRGTVDDYLASQGLAPYFAMAERYGDLYDRMVAVMESLDPGEDMDRRAERRAEIDELDAGTLATALFDIDATVAEYCRQRSLPVPQDIDALVELHIQAVGAWLDEVEARSKQ